MFEVAFAVSQKEFVPIMETPFGTNRFNNGSTEQLYWALGCLFIVFSQWGYTAKKKKTLP